jgi:uncharacterized membrane protein YbhN (UPF0104 family)
VIQRPHLKRWFHTASTLLALAGAAFVVLKIAEHSAQIDVSHFGTSAWAALTLLVVAYGASNALLARAWWQLLNYFELQATWPWTLKTYGVSQINKYIPGNIFHLAGRQALGMSAGMAARPLAQSALWELVMLAMLGLLYGALATPLGWPQMSVTAATVLWASLLACGYATLHRLGARPLALAMFWQASFLMVSGVVFIAVLLASSGTSAVAYSALPAVCGAYVLAWLAGLVTPGAPAGVGVREAVLLLLLGGLFAPADLLVAVVLGRAVTASGDLLFYLYALSIRTKAHGQV